MERPHSTARGTQNFEFFFLLHPFPPLTSHFGVAVLEWETELLAFCFVPFPILVLIATLLGCTILLADVVQKRDPDAGVEFLSRLFCFRISPDSASFRRSGTRQRRRGLYTTVRDTTNRRK